MAFDFIKYLKTVAVIVIGLAFAAGIASGFLIFALAL